MSDITRGQRMHWLDNLRTITILFVLMYHVGGVYEATGLWGSFWIVDDPSIITWVGIIGILFDILVMPTMFFISGFLAPRSLKDKSGWGFIKGKLKRLMLPWLLAVVTLIPLYKIIFLYSRNLPQQHWTSYFHFTNPNSQNWLWFLPVLFLFNVLYLFLKKGKIKIPKLSIKVAVLVSLGIAFLYSYLIGGLVGFRSWTLTPVIDFENERLLLYFLMFLLGAFSYHKHAFSEIPKSKKGYILANSLAWIPIAIHIMVRIYPFFYPEGFSITSSYRLIWWSSFYLSLLLMLYIMLQTFLRYFNKPGKIWDWMNKNSYGVYILHVVMIGIFGTLLMKLSIPALVKYPSLIVLTYVSSNGITYLYRVILKKL